MGSGHLFGGMGSGHLFVGDGEWTFVLGGWGVDIL